MLVEGRLAPRVALVAALVCGGLAVGAALVVAFFVRAGPLALPFIVSALFLAWGYTGPPLRLHSRGLGELSAAVLVTGLTPLLGFYLQTDRLEPWPVLAVLARAAVSRS